MGEITEHKGLWYGPKEDGSLLDLYLPARQRPCPLLVLFHGGGLESGGRADNKELGREFAAAGIAVASPDYRMMPAVSFPVFIEDAARAIAWLDQNAASYGYGGGLFVGGLSAGAYLSMMLCFDTHYLRDAGVPPELVDGYLFGSGQPTTHFNILKQRGEDSRLVVIDETAPLFHVRSERGAPLLIVCDDNDIPNRLEQNCLLLGTLKAFSYRSEVDFEVTSGFGHCGYADRPSQGHSRFFELALPFLKRWQNAG